MDEKQLNEYYYRKKDVEDLTNRLKEKGYGLSSVVISDINVSKSNNSMTIPEQIAELELLLIEARISALEKYLEISKYIESIEDVEIKLIARYRYLDLSSWDEIGQKLHCDRTTVSKKMRKYLKLSHNSHVDMR